jgi:hypothetical protein
MGHHPARREAGSGGAQVRSPGAHVSARGPSLPGASTDCPSLNTPLQKTLSCPISVHSVALFSTVSLTIQAKTLRLTLWFHAGEASRSILAVVTSVVMHSFLPGCSILTWER